MRRLARLAVALAALLALAGGLGATAHAVTWEASGDTTFSATASTTTTVQSPASPDLSCPVTTATGTVGTTPWATLIWTPGLHLQTTSPNCLLWGSLYATLNCTSRFTGNYQSAGGTVTTGTLDTSDCQLLYQGHVLCHFDFPQTSASYVNPSGAPGTLTTAPISGVTPTNGETSCALQTTPTYWSGTHLTVTGGSGGPPPHTGPILTRTP